MRRIARLAGALVVFALATQAAHAASISLFDDFPQTQGDNGFNAYAYDFSAQTYRLLTNTSSYMFETPSQTWKIPRVVKSTPPWVYLHPSAFPGVATVYPPEHAVLAWTADRNVAHDISGRFVAFGGGAVGVYIESEMLGVLWSSSISGGASAYFNLNGIGLTAGEKLYFGVSAGANDSSDGTRLQGDIDYLPEPATVALVGLGAIAAAIIRRRLRP